MKILPYLSSALIATGLFAVLALPDSSQSPELNENTYCFGLVSILLGIVSFIILFQKRNHGPAKK